MHRRLLSAAVVATALLTFATGCGDDDAPVTAADDTSSTTSSEQPPATEATGFYLPGELPEGWTIRFEQITNPWQELCPCDTGMWRNPEGATISTFTNQEDEEPERPFEFEGDTSVHREIPGGYLTIDGDQVRANWFDGEMTRGIFAEGLEPEVVEEVASGWKNDSPLVPPDGFELVWSGTTPEIVRRTEFFWRVFDQTSDRSMVVHMQPWMYDEMVDYTTMYPDVEPTVLDGNGLALVQTPGWEEVHLEGLWPGGALVSVASSYGEINHSAVPLSREEMLEVAGGFRPVSAEEWTSYLEATYGPEAIDACRPLLVKPRLTDLLVGPDDPDADLGVENWEMNEGCIAPWPDDEGDAVDDPDGETESPTIDTSIVTPPPDVPSAPTRTPAGG